MFLSRLETGDFIFAEKLVHNLVPKWMFFVIIKQMKKDSEKIYESPDNSQKRFNGLVAGSKGGGYAEIFPDEKKISFFKKIKKLLKKNEK